MAFATVAGLFAVVQTAKAFQSGQVCLRWLESASGSYAGGDEADAADSQTGDTDAC